MARDRLTEANAQNENQADASDIQITASDVILELGSTWPSGSSSHVAVAEAVVVALRLWRRPPAVAPSTSIAWVAARTTREAPASTGYHRWRSANSGTTSLSSQRCTSAWNGWGADDVQPTASR